MIAAWLALPAAASTWKVCADVTTGFGDMPNADTWQDYLTDDGPYPMRGVKIKVRPTSGGSWQWAWANDAGTDVGCATFSLPIGVTYTVRVESIATVDGHTIRARNSLVDPTTLNADLTTTWAIPANSAGGTKNVSLDSAATGTNEWDLLTAVSWALHHRDGGLPGQTWTLYGDDCDGVAGDGPCYSTTHDALFQTSLTSSVHLHEFGHYISHRAVGSGSSNNPYSPHTDNCEKAGTSHSPRNKEWQAEAFHEGFANFYAMVAVNASSDDDCSWVYYSTQDYDYDGDDERKAMNCRDNPMKLPSGAWIDPGDTYHDPAIDDRDYLGDIQVELGCSSESMINHATEIDYTRFFWQLYTDPAVDLTLGDILEIMDGADPDTWDGSTTTPATGEYPAYRLLESADAFDMAHGTNIGWTFLTWQVVHGVAR